MKENNILHRAKIIQGHLNKVVRMIEEKEYCVNILNQSLAVQNALKRLDEELLNHHLNTCVVSQIKSGKANEAAKEVLEVFKKRRG
jgi:DNA-binding FrmR family transcriptional regulator